jgi:hypothetical protein
MRYVDYLTDGTQQRGEILPFVSVAQFKRDAISRVTDHECLSYRTTIVETIVGGEGIVWDTDDVFLISRIDRGENGRRSVPPVCPNCDRAECPSAGTWAPCDVEDFLPAVDVPTHAERDASAASSIREHREAFGVVRGEIAAEDVLRAEAEAAVRMIAQHRQMESASMLARHSRELWDAMTGLDKEDDAAAYHALEYVFVRAASECHALGWPLDGNGVPLPECKDEA